ncbi:MAG: hypothetical protein IPH54_22370 [Rhodoferax sp.]|nr:hypothetical protein [Rhodoferax sp.]
MPYGVYDLSANAGWPLPVSALITIHRSSMSNRSTVGGARWARRTHPQARELLITADAGQHRITRAYGRKASVCRRHRTEDRRFATFRRARAGGNKIEHRMFCHITRTGVDARLKVMRSLST